MLGGWLVGAASWRAVFWINVPVAALVLWITARHVPESHGGSAAASEARFDTGGAVMGAIGLGLGTWSLIAAGDRGASAGVLAAGGGGVIALLIFVLIERHVRAPLIPPALFASRQFTGVNLVTLAVYGGIAGLFFLLVVQLQQVAGFPPVEAGATLLPITLLMLLLSERAGALAERIGPRRLMTIGPLIMAAGMLLLARVGPHATWVRDVLPGTVVFGLGLSATVAPLTATALSAADSSLSGVASGVNNAVARTAALLAVAVLPVVAGLGGDAFRDPLVFARGFHIAMRISAALVAAGGILAWLTIRDALPDGRPACDRSRLARRSYCAIDGPPAEPAVPAARAAAVPTSG